MAIITFGGRVGGGKTTVAPLVAHALNYETVYMGGIFRDIARKHNLSIEKFYEQLGESPELEKSVDVMQATLMQQQDNMVIQGRVAFFFARQSKFPIVNIFLDASPEVRAKRKIDEGVYAGKNVDEVMEIHDERERTERERYKKLYGINDHLDPALFDVVCDTTRMTPEEVRDFLLVKIKGALNKSS